MGCLWTKQQEPDSPGSQHGATPRSAPAAARGSPHRRPPAISLSERALGAVASPQQSAKSHKNRLALIRHESLRFTPRKRAMTTMTVERDEKTLLTGITKFNIKPKKGIQFLVSAGLLQHTPVAVANFLKTPRLFSRRKELQTGLNKTRVGEYLGMAGKTEEEKVFHAELTAAFLALFDFSQSTFDQALRAFLSEFRLPGEAQIVDRMMNGFATEYCSQNPGTFRDPDTAYVLAFSVMMLNTTLHNPNIPDDQRTSMTAETFATMNRGINGGEDLPEQLLTEIYASVAEKEIELAVETEVVTFFNPAQEGWLYKKGGGMRKWKKRFFLLNDNCLYYFTNPESEIDKASPRCIIPLDGTDAVPLGDSELRLSSSDKTRPLLKSVKRTSKGLVHATRAALVLRAASSEERDQWLDALRQEVLHPFRRVASHKKFMLRSRSTTGMFPASPRSPLALSPARDKARSAQRPHSARVRLDKQLRQLAVDSPSAGAGVGVGAGASSSTPGRRPRVPARPAGLSTVSSDSDDSDMNSRANLLGGRSEKRRAPRMIADLSEIEVDVYVDSSSDDDEAPMSAQAASDVYQERIASAAAEVATPAEADTKEDLTVDPQPAKPAAVEQVIEGEDRQPRSPATFITPSPLYQPSPTTAAPAAAATDAAAAEPALEPVQESEPGHQRATSAFD